MMLTKAWIMSIYRNFFFLSLAPSLSIYLTWSVCEFCLLLSYFFILCCDLLYLLPPTKQIINSTRDNKVICRSWHTIEISFFHSLADTSICLLENEYTAKTNASKKICKQNHKHHFISHWRAIKNDFALSFSLCAIVHFGCVVGQPFGIAFLIHHVHHMPPFHFSFAVLTRWKKEIM